MKRTEDTGPAALTIPRSTPSRLRVRHRGARRGKRSLTLAAFAWPIALAVLGGGGVAHAQTPSAPGGLKPTSTSQTSIALSWTTPANTGGSAITGYQYTQQEDGMLFGAWTDIPMSDATTTSYTVPNLTAATRYAFKVRAKNVNGGGAASRVANAATDCTTVTVRLRNQGNASALTDGKLEGRLEVCQNDKKRREHDWTGGWGSVCDDFFNKVDAVVACDGLGHTDGIRLASGPRAGFGETPGPIWLDNVACSGTEESVLACRSQKYPWTNCFHSEDVNLSCSTPAPTITTSTTILVPANQTFVAQLEAEIVKHRAGNVVWELAGGADQSHFMLSTEGVLSFTAVKNFGSPDDNDTDGAYEVSVQAADGMATAQASLTIRLQAADTDAPALVFSDVDGRSLTLTYDEELDDGSVPATSAFAVLVSGANRGVGSVTVRGKSVVLTLAAPVEGGELVKLSYSKPSTNPIQDRAGNDASAFSQRTVQDFGEVLSRIVLVDTTSNTDVLELSRNPDSPTIFNLHGQSSNEFGIRVDTAEGAAIRTVLIALRQEPQQRWRRTQWDSRKPYSLYGNPRARKVGGAALPVGEYFLHVLTAAVDTRPGRFYVPHQVRLSFFVIDTAPLEGNVAPSATPLTAQFTDLPQSHDGHGVFSFRIEFSEEISASAEDMRQHALDVSGGTVTGAARVDNRNDLWSIAVTPSGTGDITISLLGGRDCSDSGAVCTRSGKQLSESLGVIVPGAGADTSGNTEATGAPTISGTPRVGETLTASTSQIADADGIDDVTFSYQWIASDGVDDTLIAGATDSSYLLRDTDAGKSIKVRVTFRDDGDTEESLVSEATAEVLAALTADFENVPSEHDGSSMFTFRVRFSLEPRVSYLVLRDQSLSVTGGTVRKALRVNGEHDLREIHVEPAGYGDVTVTLVGGLACGTTGAICTADNRPLSNTRTATIQGPPALAVADARTQEAPNATVDFPVTLSRVASGTVIVDYATAGGTAGAGTDFTAQSGTLTFAVGETARTVQVPVLDDPHDEGEETFTLALSNPTGAYIADGQATGTIANADPLPRAWLARFGRTAAGHVLDAVGDRLNAPTSESQATLAGRLVRAAEPEESARTLDVFAALAPRTMQLHELLDGSSFDLAVGAGPDGNDGGRWTVWGRGAWSRFAGADGELTLNGQVLTAATGADYEHDRLLAGVAVAYSSGDGSFRHRATGTSGELTAALLGVHPYLRLTLHQRLAVWGLAGYAVHGDLTLDSTSGRPLETGAGMLMGAFGARGTLLSAAAGGLELTAAADGLLLRTRSEATAGLAASEAEVERLRLRLRASYRALPLAGGLLTPEVEVGGRYDGGDAETGVGLVLGGSLNYALPAWGLSLSGFGGGLLVHESEGFENWGAGGALRLDPGTPGRGSALSVAPSWGSAHTAAALWDLPLALRPAVHGVHHAHPAGSLAAELSYGMDAPGARGDLVPYLALASSAAGERTWRLGSRLNLDSGFTLSLEGTRRERAAAPDHAVTLSGSLRY